MPFSLIPFLLLAIPAAEIAVFILVGGQIGVLWTFAAILATAILGSILLRVQGFQIVNRLREETNAGRVPGRELGHGAMILVAGVLLLTPGFVTDALGFLLFFPPFRNLIWRWAATRIRFTTTMDGFADRFETRGYNENQRGRGAVYDLDPEDYESHEPGENDVLEDSAKSDRPSNGSSPWRKP